MDSVHTIYCNARFPEAAMAELRVGVGRHRLLVATELHGNLSGAGDDPLLDEADIAIGQPGIPQIMRSARLRWTHLTSAGYTRYDREDLRAALGARGAMLTNSSAVYAEPCAEHILAMMMAIARQLPMAFGEQAGARGWRQADLRIRSRLLPGQSVVMLGYGAIGRRLAEMLQPLRVQITAVRRNAGVAGADGVRVVTSDQIDELLPRADHIVNVLPESATTDRFLDGRRIASLKSTAIVYNVGRGATIDQPALLAALAAGRIAAAYLDVTDPEPPKPDDPVWSTPNCYVTPHAAGGHSDEFERLVRHFLDNLRRFDAGEDLLDRVV